jgi:phospholipase/carboxylesterase
MNRIAQYLATATVAPQPSGFAGSVDGRRVFFLPTHYEPNYAYPLVVWLPGGGQPAEDVLAVMPHLSRQNYIAVGVRSGLSPEQTQPARCSAQRVAGSVAKAVAVAARRFRIDRQRVFLAGYGAGGTLALRIALNEPQSFAGALSFCGRWPCGQRPLAAWTALQRLPIFMAQAMHSTSYPLERFCRDLRTIHAARLRAEIRQYTVDDCLATTMLEDANRWMMALVTGQLTSDRCDTQSVDPGFSAN